MKELESANQPAARRVQPWLVVFEHKPMYCSYVNAPHCTARHTDALQPITLIFCFAEILDVDYILSHTYAGRTTPTTFVVLRPVQAVPPNLLDPPHQQRNVRSLRKPVPPNLLDHRHGRVRRCSTRGIPCKGCQRSMTKLFFKN